MIYAFLDTLEMAPGSAVIKLERSKENFFDLDGFVIPDLFFFQLLFYQLAQLT